MSQQDHFEKSSENDDENLSKSKSDKHHEYHPGATCSEISENQSTKLEMPIFSENIENEEIDDYGDFPLPPPSSPTLPTLYNDLYLQPTYPRRYSCFPAQFENMPNVNQRVNRAPSLPALGVFASERQNQDQYFKKLLFDNSRRSSYESAYHSHGSDRSSRTPNTASQLEDLDYAPEYSSTFANFNSRPALEEISLNENIERAMIERRNSLSFEAIRSYFLEFNPYMHQEDVDPPCSEHNDNPASALFCPHCNQRRNSIEQVNAHFRTNAHRQIVERQFEDLFNIPDPSRSRATSIDLFGGLGIPFTIQEQRNLQNEDVDQNDNKCDDKSPDES